MPSPLAAVFKRVKSLKSDLGYRSSCLQRRFGYQLAHSPDGRATIALFGRAPYTRPLVDDYLNHPGRCPLHSFTSWPTAHLAHQLARTHGLVVFDEGTEPRSLQPQLLHTTKLVGMAREITGTIEQARASLSLQTRTQLRNAEARGLRLEISREPDHVSEFHARYYSPSMQNRHETLAFVRELEAFQQILRAGGELLRVFDGGRWIAAILASSSPAGYRLEQCGWLGGDARFLETGAIKFLYWQGIVQATQRGLPRLHFGHSPNDLANGIIFQKSRWGARIVPADLGCAKWSLLLNPAHASIRDYLQRHCLLCPASDRDGAFFVLSARQPSEVPASSSQSPSLSAWYRLRETPAAPSPGAPVNPHLPSALSPWFDRLPLPVAKS